MGNFIVVHSPNEREADEIFRAGLSDGLKFAGRNPIDVKRSPRAMAASFPRQNRTGSPVAVDSATGCWLLASGVWFHQAGFASGEESRLLSRMIEIGPDKSANELEGFFAVVFYDARSDELFVITDLIGSKHCFIRRIGETAAISSSSLLLAGLGETTIDPTGCEEFLRTGVIYEGRTIYREIRKIPGAQILKIDRAGNQVSRSYWSVADLDPDKYDGVQAVRQLREKLPEAVRRIRRTFDRPVCDLTGGYDSRALVSAFLFAGADFETVVAGPPESPDVVISKGLARITGKNHRHLESDGAVTLDRLEDSVILTDGGYDLIDYARIRSIQRSLVDRFDITINGSFGELGRGYWWELLRPVIGKRERLDSHKIAARRYAVDPQIPALFPPDVSLDLIDHFAGMIDRANAEIDGWPNTAQMDNAYLKLRMQHWQGRIASSTDRVWPCLSPFMMRSVMEIMLQTGARWRNRSLLARMLTAELHPQLAAYPLEHGHPALPLNRRTWPKFIPVIGVYAKKAAAKAGLKLGRTNLNPGRGEPARTQLWRDPSVSDLLDPRTMKLGCLIEKKRLESFIAASRKPDFQFDQQWNRLLSAEMALRSAV